MWELFMESEYPSKNDIIATPIGGAALGEVFYRTSDLMLDNRTSGSERFGREALSFLLSPMRGLTRILTGEAWERKSIAGKEFGNPPYKLDVSLGTRLLTSHDNDCLLKAGASARIDLEYGDCYSSSRKPYDYFSLLMELNVMKTQPVFSRVEIIGSLFTKEVIDTKRCNLTLGLYSISIFSTQTRYVLIIRRGSWNLVSSLTSSALRHRQAEALCLVVNCLVLRFTRWGT